MGMIGEYARLTPGEFRRAVAEPGWAQEHVFRLREAQWEQPSAPAEARSFDVDKAWHGLEHLFARAGFAVAAVHGEHRLPGAGDWGQGEPRYLTPRQVSVGARELAEWSWARLVDGVDGRDLDEAGVYPFGWEDEESMAYLRAHHGGLVQFFRAAARDGDVVLMWIG